MSSINNLLAELDERIIAQRIGIPHDETRMRYSLRSNTVRDWDEFVWIITDYYTKHYAACVSPGANLPDFVAFGRAEELLDREYHRRGGNMVTAYPNARDGLNGGMRAVLDVIAEGLKAEAVEHYIRYVFNRYVDPFSWEEKMEIIRQFIAQYGVHLGSSIRADQPERYANNYEELIRAYITAMQKTSSIFRRL
jgi:hypothetical protein